MINSRKIPARTALMNTLAELLHKKPFQKISVNEFCETAQVSRSAFYANFEDKYHLFSCCLEAKGREMEKQMANHSPEEFLYVMLDFVQKENRFFYNTFIADLDEEIAESFYQFFEKHLTEILRQKAADGLILPGPVDVVTSFYIGVLTGTTLRWIKSNYRLAKEDLAACQYRLLKDII